MFNMQDFYGLWWWNHLACTGTGADNGWMDVKHLHKMGGFPLPVLLVLYTVTHINTAQLHTVHCLMEHPCSYQ
jgi:hypothetical protein